MSRPLPPVPASIAGVPPTRPASRLHGMLAALALLLASPAAAEPFALLASATGTVTVTTAAGGRPSPATFGRALERGDRISVAPAGKATVYFSDGNVVELGGGSTITIGGTAGRRPAVGPGAALPTGVYSNVARFVTRGSRETGLVAQSNLRGDDTPPLLLSPRRSDILQDRPDFAWRAVPGATRYRLTLTSEAGDLWTRETGETGIAFPVDAPPLARDRDFLWRVEARAGEREVAREECLFHVAGGPVVSSVRSDLDQIAQSAGGSGHAATLFLAGSYLSGRGFYLEAAARFDSLAKSVPDSPAPHEALGHVYRAIGLHDRSATEYQRALELSRKP